MPNATIPFRRRVTEFGPSRLTSYLGRRIYLASRLSASLTLLAMSFGYGVVQLDVTIVNTALDA